jgi:hypothetical protein
MHSAYSLCPGQRRIYVCMRVSKRESGGDHEMRDMYGVPVGLPPSKKTMFWVACCLLPGLLWRGMSALCDRPDRCFCGYYLDGNLYVQYMICCSYLAFVAASPDMLSQAILANHLRHTVNLIGQEIVLRRERHAKRRSDISKGVWNT